MDRRRFLQGIAVTTAGMGGLPVLAEMDGRSASDPLGAATASASQGAPDISTEGHTLLCSFIRGSETWKVYEDLRTREGSIVFVSTSGAGRVLTRNAEATFAEVNPPYLGLSMSDIGMAGPDLLADRLLQNGDPDPEQVKSAAPPLGSALSRRPNVRVGWDTFVGTRECLDTMPIYPSGNTRTYHPVQSFPALNAELARKRYEGLLGGWMPAVRKVMPVSEAEYYEVVVFGDVKAHDKFIVQTWHRTVRIENGKITKVEYGHSYPAFPPARQDPDPKEFYHALLEFTLYWEKQMHDVAPAALPEKAWVDMATYAFVKEQMVRPGGVYPKYGAVDRDYYGSEYDGFQDIFTSALYTNLEWGRFEMAAQVLDNYYSDFVDARGMVNMRGPETAQFGLTLSLLARYFNYTGDRTLLVKHRAKIEATAAILTELHDESLKLPHDAAGYGLIHGWSESDSCLAPQPMTWWQPYFNNSAFAARGLKDIARTWKNLNRSKADPAMEKTAAGWLMHSRSLEDSVVASIRQNVRRDMSPPYIGPLPGTKLTIRESLATEHPSPQQWAHRVYAELLQADVLPPDLANLVIDSMRANGATTMGVVANVVRPNPESRNILGFISYGYAQMLLRLDRIEEFLLFLYAHRFHDHTRGSWTAGEVAGITGGTALFCIPAQQTIPLLLRWMLVLEDSEEDLLYLGKGLPRDWVVSGKEIRIDQAPTRWGRVNFKMQAKGANQVIATVDLPKNNGPKELHIKFRLPPANELHTITANGATAQISGLHKDTVVIETGAHRHFEVVAHFS
jgi:hypothetical protein